MDFVKLIQNKDEFTQAVKDQIASRVFDQLELMKKEMANDFLQNQEQD